MDAFYERMEARKLREMEEQAEREKSVVTDQYAYTATLSLQILSQNFELAQETLEIIAKHLEQFEDIKNVKGELS